MSYEVVYPSAVPVQAAKDLFEIVRAGDIVARRSQAAAAAYNVQGYVQSIVFGSADDKIVGSSGPAMPATEAEGLAFLESVGDGGANAWNPEKLKQILAWLAKVILPLVLES